MGRRWLWVNRAPVTETASRSLGRGDADPDGQRRDRSCADHPPRDQIGGRVAVYRILEVEEPVATARRWGIFVDGERVYGSENLYDCIRWRDRRVQAIIHGEYRRPRVARL